uniref:Uncharacterized protein n=1 Tax=Caenorhabditis japonica TaxID=281687 RepID=A0A8R1EKD1_CAEJA
MQLTYPLEIGNYRLVQLHPDKGGSIDALVLSIREESKFDLTVKYIVWQIINDC